MPFETYFGRNGEFVRFRDGALLTPGPTPPSLGAVMYTPADMAQWLTSDSEYTRLASDNAGNLASYSPVNYGTSLSAAEWTSLGSGYGSHILAQAGLWKADGNIARYNRVIAALQGFEAVTSWTPDVNSPNQHRLVAGWMMPLICAAAAIVDYHSSGLDAFYRATIPILDISGSVGSNWFATLTDGGLACASRCQDQALWDAQVALFETRISKAFWITGHYNGFRVDPLVSSTGIPSNNTEAYWGWYSAHGYTYCAVQGFGSGATKYFELKSGWRVDGLNAEFHRDLDHVNMGLGAWAHCMRTMVACGTTPSPKAVAVMTTGVNLHAYRVRFNYDGNGNPVPNVDPAGLPSNPLDPNIDGSRFLGWPAMIQAIGVANMGADLNYMNTRTQTLNWDAGGANHLACGAFLDKVH